MSPHDVSSSASAHALGRPVRGDPGASAPSRPAEETGPRRSGPALVGKLVARDGGRFPRARKIMLAAAGDAVAPPPGQQPEPSGMREPSRQALCHRMGTPRRSSRPPATRPDLPLADGRRSWPPPPDTARAPPPTVQRLLWPNAPELRPHRGPSTSYGPRR